MNRHAYGQITLDGWAQHWMRARRARLTRINNNPRERQAYHAAMDRLFLQAEEVIYQLKKQPHNN